MTKMVLVRHGSSVWNDLNLFTGWTDVPLSTKGILQAQETGQKLSSIPFDVVFTSQLQRAQQTASIIFNYQPKTAYFVNQDPKSHAHDLQTMIPIYKSWHLNERFYGKLQGMNKETAAEIYGKEQVHLWRRSYELCPPEGESLEQTSQRTWQYFESTIQPLLQQNKNVLICAHGNSLRSIIMNWEKLTPEEILTRELATGEPVIYEITSG